MTDIGPPALLEPSSPSEPCRPGCRPSRRSLDEIAGRGEIVGDAAASAPGVVVLSSHISRKKAIMAVTKSA
jgi:hypothetical protein